MNKWYIQTENKIYYEYDNDQFKQSKQNISVKSVENENGQIMNLVYEKPHQMHFVSIPFNFTNYFLVNQKLHKLTEFFLYSYKQTYWSAISIFQPQINSICTNGDIIYVLCSNQINAIDTKTNKIETKILQNCTYPNSTSVCFNNKLINFGGKTSTAHYKQFLIIDIQQWKEDIITISEIPPQCDAHFQAFQDSLYLIGGNNSQGKIKRIWKLYVLSKMLFE